MFGSSALLERRQPARAHGATVGQPTLSEELVALSRVPAQAACAECSSCVEGLDQAEAERRCRRLAENRMQKLWFSRFIAEIAALARQALNFLGLSAAVRSALSDV